MTIDLTMQISYPVPSLKPSAAAEKGVLTIINGLETTWNAHDMKGFAGYLADECQWVNVVGMHWVGKESVYRAHEAFHKTIFRNVEYHNEAASLRQITPDVVIAVVRVRMGAFTTPDGHKVPEALNRLTYVMVRRNRTWRICSAQNTSVDPVAAPNNPEG